MIQIVLNAYTLKHKHYKTDREFFKSRSKCHVQVWGVTCACTRAHIHSPPAQTYALYPTPISLWDHLQNRTAWVRWLEMGERRGTRRSPRSEWRTWNPDTMPGLEGSTSACGVILLSCLQKLRPARARIKDPSYCYLLPPIPFSGY